MTHSLVQHDLPVLNVPPTYSKDFNQMRNSLATLTFNLTKIMEQKQVSVDDLKFYVGLHSTHLEPQISHAVTIRDVMTIVHSQCTLVDVSLLDHLVRNIGIEDEVKEYIKAYEVQTIECCNDIALSLCFNQSLREDTLDTLLICNTLQFVLDWKPEEHILQDIKSVLWKGFGDISDSIQILNITEGSVKVTCYIPETLTDILVMLAQKQIEILQGSGMIMLSIGHHIIFYANHSDNNDKVSCIWYHNIVY